MVVPHSLVVDECDNRVTVADRENKRMVTFNLDTGAVMGERWGGVNSESASDEYVCNKPVGVSVVGEGGGGGRRRRGGG
jgi:hypothetical protein